MNSPSWTLDWTEALESEEIQRVVADLRRRGLRSANSRMNLAMFRLAANCGLRASECTGLRMRDVRLTGPNPAVDVPNSIAKNGHGGRIPLGFMASIVPDLAAWRAERVRQGAKPADLYLCCQSKSTAGQQLDRRNARNRFKAACRALGPDRCSRLTHHHGRHTAISHWIAAGWPLPIVRDMARHLNLATTSRYAHALLSNGQKLVDPFAAGSDSR